MRTRKEGRKDHKKDISQIIRRTFFLPTGLGRMREVKVKGALRSRKNGMCREREREGVPERFC